MTDCSGRTPKVHSQNILNHFLARRKDIFGQGKADRTRVPDSNQSRQNLAKRDWEAAGQMSSS
jgi:hypothetical protein